MNNKKYYILILIGIIIIAVCSILVLKNKKDNSIVFSMNDLVEDYYIYEDNEKHEVYENIIYVPKNMVKTIQKQTSASYSYKDNEVAVNLKYSSYKDIDSLNKLFTNDEKFIKKDFYNILEKDDVTKIYFENSNGYYQTIEIYIQSLTNNKYKIGTSYTDLLENLKSNKKNALDYSIKKENDYYTDSIYYNVYNDKTNTYNVKADYKVSSSKYGSVYDSEYKYHELYLDESSISFYEGEITADIDSVKSQTRIRMFFIKIMDLDIDKEIENDLKWPLNQTAFKDVTKDMVKIETNTLNHLGKEAKYYKVVSDNNNSHGERINVYYPVKDDIYYMIQIYGGENKNLNLDMIKEFLPTNVEVK